MKSSKKLFIIFLFSLPFLPLYSQTIINDKNDLLTNSDTTNNRLYVLNSGIYAVEGQIDISSDTRANFAMNKGSSELTVNNLGTGLTDPLFIVSQFNLDGGTVNVTGGTGAGMRVTYGGVMQTGGIINARANANDGMASFGRVTQTGGVINAYGGTSTNATGFISGNPFLQDAANDADAVINAYGGSALRSDGMHINNYSTQNGGTIKGTGGSGSNSSGFYISTTLTKNGGILEGTGGIGTNAYGVSVGTLNMNNGTLTGRGGTGSGQRAYGVRLEALNLTDGIVTAYGGTGTGQYLYGIYSPAAKQTGGSITSTGGTANNSVGFYSTNFTFEDGDINLTGGSGLSAYGLFSDSFTMDGGTFSAAAGTANFSHGIAATGFTQNDGKATFKAGSNEVAYGGQVTNYTLNGGDIDVIGSDNSLSRGLNTDVFTLAGGNIVATGGAYSDAGSYVTSAFYTNTLDMSDGSLTATGGSGNGSYGAIANLLNQNGGYITAAGGSFNNTHGLYSSAINQTGGTITARGGSVGNGLLITGQADFGGTLRLEREGNGYSVDVSSSGSITFKSGSSLIPIIDLSNVNDSLATGIINTAAGGTVTIESGAEVSPLFKNTRSITKASTERSFTFINTNGGSIIGDFAEQAGGFTIEYTILKENSDSEYIVKIGRKQNLSDVIGCIDCSNSKNFVTALDSYLLANPGNTALEDIWTMLDNSTDISDFRNRTSQASRSVTPQDATRMPSSSIRQTDAVQTDFNLQLQNLLWSNVKHEIYNPAFPYYEYESNKKISVWANPLYQQSSHIHSDCGDFSNAQEKFGGSDIGFAKDLGGLLLGGQGHVLRADYKSPTADSRANNYGFTVGGRFYNLRPYSDTFTWLDFSVSYSYFDYTQKRIDYYGEQHDSSPYSNLFRGSLLFGNEIILAERYLFTPQAGVDYTFIKQSAYSERNATDLALRVSKSNYTSLRPKIGFDVQTNLASRFNVIARGFYRFETLDNYASLDSNLINTPDFKFTTKGEKGERSSANLGGGIKYQYRDIFMAGINYDFLIEDNYMGHNYSLNLAFIF